MWVDEDAAFRTRERAVEDFQIEVAPTKLQLLNACASRKPLPASVVVPKRVLNSSKAGEDANQIKAEGVAEEFFHKQLSEPPLRRFQIHSRLRELR
jgi:hypothetical protein